MKSQSRAQARRQRNIRRLAGVNRRITKLCNELESLQQVQGALERDIEHESKTGPGQAPKRRKGSI